MRIPGSAGPMAPPTRRAAVLGAAALSAVGLGRARAAGGLVVLDAWARAALAGGTGAAYLSIRNDDAAPEWLLGAETPVARAVELHGHHLDGAVMRMREMAGVELPPGQTVAFLPGGLHLMLVGLRQPLERGRQVPLALSFARAGRREVTLRVEAAGARGPRPGAPHHGH